MTRDNEWLASHCASYQQKIDALEADPEQLHRMVKKQEVSAKIIKNFRDTLLTAQRAIADKDEEIRQLREQLQSKQ